MHCFCPPTWRQWRHMKMLHTMPPSPIIFFPSNNFFSSRILVDRLADSTVCLFVRLFVCLFLSKILTTESICYDHHWNSRQDTGSVGLLVLLLDVNSQLFSSLCVCLMLVWLCLTWPFLISQTWFSVLFYFFLAFQSFMVGLHSFLFSSTEPLLVCQQTSISLKFV